MFQIWPPNAESLIKFTIFSDQYLHFFKSNQYLQFFPFMKTDGVVSFGFHDKVLQDKLKRKLLRAEQPNSKLAKLVYQSQVLCLLVA